MDDRFHALAELAVHGANVQPGQVVAVGATVGQEELARAVAEAAYRRGALFVDVTYFDPYVKRSRIEHADPETLAFVPPWYGDRVEQLSERGDARIALAGVVDPDVFEGLDPALLGTDQLPGLKETARIIGERTTNWTIVPCPHPAWAKLVYPELDEAAAYERLWAELIHVLRLDEPEPTVAWDERVDAAQALGAGADRPALRRGRAERAGHRAHRRAAADEQLVGGRLHDARRPPAPAEPADRRGLHDARPDADRGPRRLDQAARAEGRHDRARTPHDLRGRPRGRGRRRRERRRAPRPHGRRRGRRPPGRAGAGRPAGPHRAARHDLLRHAAGRERGQPHRASASGFPSPSRARTSSGSTAARSTSTS